MHVGFFANRREKKKQAPTVTIALPSWHATLCTVQTNSAKFCNRIIIKIMLRSDSIRDEFQGAPGGHKLQKRPVQRLSCLRLNGVCFARLTTADLPCSLFGEKNNLVHKKIKGLCRAWEATESLLNRGIPN